MGSANVLLCALANVLLAAAWASSPTTDVIRTSTGMVVGGLLPSNNNSQAFFEIPFGQPPTGTLRLQPPLPAEPWDDVKNCTTNTNQMCMQANPTPWKKTAVGSEDCLYLNVFTPSYAVPHQTDLPVFLWLYGGGFVEGDAIQKSSFVPNGSYNGSKISEEFGVMVVVPNYREGALGFLASSHGHSGSSGLQDQQLAMKWVQQNAKAFGGDPNQVTLAGESAGAFSVCAHLTMPSSSGLFNRVIMESGVCSNPAFFQAEERAREWGELFALSLGCDAGVLDSEAFQRCMQQLEGSDFIPGTLTDFNSNWPFNSSGNNLTALPMLAPVMAWGPAIAADGILPQLPSTALKNGDFDHSVPVLMGTNKQEGTLFTVLIPLVLKHISRLHLIPFMDNTGFNASVAHFFKPKYMDAIVEQYPPIHGLNQNDRMVKLITDSFFTCEARKNAKSIQSHGANVFVYQFTADVHDIYQDAYGVSHASEIPYVFGNQWGSVFQTIKTKAEQAALTKLVQYYWFNFVRTGEPTAQPLPAGVSDWPLWSPEKMQSLNVSLSPNVVLGLFNETCNFWDEIEFIHK